MKEVRKYGWIVFICILGFSCATTANNEYFENTDQNSSVIAETLLKEQFLAGELSNVQLHAFENKAIDKLQDYIDYANIISNPEIDPVFHNESLQQLKEILYHKTLYNSKLDIFNNSDTLYYYTVDHEDIIQGLGRDRDQYIGILKFELYKFTKDSQLVGSQVKEIRIFALRNTKQFGDEYEMIWEVLLDTINFNTLNPE